MFLLHILHLLFILFITITPFTNNIILLQYHLVIIPFLMIHWILNNDNCFFSTLESLLTGKPVNETFIGRIVKPIYNVQNKHIWIITILLYLVTIIKLIMLIMNGHNNRLMVV